MSDNIDVRRKRLGELVELRRRELGMARGTCARAAGVDYRTLLKIEEGGSVQGRSLDAVSKVLGWPIGAATAFLAGEGPEPAVIPRPVETTGGTGLPPDVDLNSPIEIAIWSDETLTPSERRLMIEAYRLNRRLLRGTG